MSEQEKKEVNAILNVFDKGMVTDLDTSRKQNDSFIHGKNVRLFQSGNGMVVTNVAGNMYDEGEGVGFRISEGFIPLGAIEIGGFLFIFSCNVYPVNGEEYHEGEIGCFPSYNDQGEIERAYRPFQNLQKEVKTSGTLTIGKVYVIQEYVSGDSFTSVGSSYNLSGTMFRATGTSPTWTNGSTLVLYGDFTTEELQFNPNHQIEALAWEIVDNSVNIYFTDNYNPIRVINCGFRLNGELNNMTYREDDFPNAISLFLSTNKQVGIELYNYGTSDGGSLMGGNYVFFFRFGNKQMNFTHFCIESSALQVNDGDTIQRAEGTVNATRRKVQFKLLNLDKSYYYVEVGYIRYYSDMDGNVVHETALVNKDYLIPQTTATEMLVTITGNEGTRVLTLDEILYDRPEDDTCKTIASVERRLFGANWKGPVIYHQSMIDFASKITISYDDTLQKDADIFVDTTLAAEYAQYKDDDLTYTSVGYFRGEAYPFGIRYELKNGYMTDVFPLTGNDELRPADGTNDLGIYRFPDNKTTRYFEYDSGGKVNILRVVFDMEEAILDTAGSTDMNGLAWIKENVRAFHFVRGDRHKTMEYQGVVVYGCAPKMTSADDWDLTRLCSLGEPDGAKPDHHCAIQDRQNVPENPGVFDQTFSEFTKWNNRIEYNAWWGTGLKDGASYEEPDSQNSRTDIFIPIYRGYAPMIYKDNNKNNDEDGVNKVKVRNYMSRWFLKKNRLCVFSPDHLFTPLADVTRINRVERIFATSTKTAAPGEFVFEDGWSHDNTDDSEAYSEVYPRWRLAEFVKPNDTQDDLESDDIVVVPVGDGSNALPQNDVSGFVNFTKDFWASDVEAMFYALKTNESKVVSNRGVITPKYIGIIVNDEIVDDHFNLDIVNLYNCDYRNTEVTSFFPSLAGVRYSKIGGSLEIDWTTNFISDPPDPLTCGYGDCFIQRSYFKVNAWPGTSFYADGWDDDIPESETVVDWADSNVRKKAVYKSSLFTHGVLMGIVTENACNIAMRNGDQDHSYFPRVYNKFEFALRCHSSNRSEAFILNHGYNKTLSPKQGLAYDPKFMVNDRNRKARIRYSDVMESASMIDAFRMFRPLSMVDFSTISGGINKLVELNGYLVSIQDKNINLHFVNERQLQAGVDSSDMVLGRGDILSDKVRVLANYGSQHQWSITKSLNHVYGVDYNRRKIWRIGKDSNYGYGYFNVIDISSQTLISSYVKELFDRWDTFGDIGRVYADNPIVTEGIFTIYDPKNDEVLFVFRNLASQVVADEPINPLPL